MVFPPQGSGSGGGGSSIFPTMIPKLSDLIIDTSKNWEGRRIRNIGYPSDFSDATNKQYVDNKFTGSNNEILRYDSATDSLKSSNGITITDERSIVLPCVSASNVIPINLKASTEGIDSGIAALRVTPYMSCGYLGHSMIGLFNNLLGTTSIGQAGSGIFLNSSHVNAIEMYIRQAGSSVWKRPIIIEDNASDGALTVASTITFNTPLQVNNSLNISGTYNINGSPHNHDERYVSISDPEFDGELDMKGHKIINLGTPEYALEAANKVYVDSYVLGLQWKAPVEGFATDKTLLESENPYDKARFIVSENAVDEWATYVNYIVQWDESKSNWIYIEPESMWTVTCYHCSEGITNLTYSEDDGWVIMGITTYHGGLAGLDNDDHFQYIHISNARNISAIHTFTGSKPFNVSSRTLVNNLNAELLNGVSLSTLQRVVTSSYDGLCPKLSGNSNQFLNGHGQWVTIDTGGSGSGDGVWGSIIGDITNQIDLINLLNNKLGINEIAYDSHKLGGIDAWEFPSYSDIPQAGKGLTEIFNEDDERVYLNVYTDNNTIFINSLGQLQVIGSAGDPYVFATFPTIIANSAVGAIEPGYILSGKHIKTVMMAMTGSGYVYSSDNPYIYGFISFYHSDMYNFSDVLDNMYKSYIYETESTKMCNFGTDEFPTAKGYISFMYPEKYGILKSIELGTSSLSQDISSEFSTYSVLYGVDQYIVYKHDKLTEIPISQYIIRFVSEREVV